MKATAIFITLCLVACRSVHPEGSESDGRPAILWDGVTELCVSCGTMRHSTYPPRVWKVSDPSEESRWLLSLSVDHHKHAWVFYSMTSSTSGAMACGMPQNHLSTLGTARSVKGDDPRLAELAADFVATDPSQTRRRDDIARDFTALIDEWFASTLPNKPMQTDAASRRR